MAPLHSQGCEGAACPCLDTRLQPPEKTITNWFLFLFSPAVSLHRTGYHPRYCLLGFRAGALNSHLCLGRKDGQGGQGGPGGAREGQGGARGGQGGARGVGWGARQPTNWARCPGPPLQVSGSLESAGSGSLGQGGGRGGARGCQRKCPPKALVVGFRVF